MANVTLRQVAEEVGLSPTTVSQILSAAPGFSYRAETIARVQETASRLGYRPHAAARMLRLGASTLAGIAVRPQLTTSPTVSELVLHTQNALTRRHYQPLLLDPAQLVSNAVQEPFPSPRLLAGLICADLAMETGMPEFYRQLQDTLPLVALYAVPSDDVDTVTTDRTRGIEMAVEHLVQLGHRCLVYVQTGENTEHPGTASKRAGWVRACERHGIGEKARSIVNVDASLLDLRPCGVAVAEHVLRTKPRPTGIVSFGDDLAICSIQQLMARGLRVPEDISVIGFDGVRYGPYITPPLTTVSQPMEGIAVAAVNRLLELIAARRAGASTPKATQRLVEPQLIIRASTAPPPRRRTTTSEPRP